MKKLLDILKNLVSKLEANEKKQVEEPIKKEVKKEVKKETVQKEAPKKAAAPEVDLSGVEAKETPATEYLKSILVGMGFTDVSVTAREAAEDVYFEITCGEDYGNIFGRRGETLDALQYLTGLVANHVDNSYYKITINTGNYREKREKTLQALAIKTARHALRSGRNQSLEPMNPYERKVIHCTLQNHPNVKTRSEGKDPYRKVIIECK